MLAFEQNFRSLLKSQDGIWLRAIDKQAGGINNVFDCIVISSPNLSAFVVKALRCKYPVYIWRSSEKFEDSECVKIPFDNEIIDLVRILDGKGKDHSGTKMIVLEWKRAIGDLGIKLNFLEMMMIEHAPTLSLPWINSRLMNNSLLRKHVFLHFQASMTMLDLFQNNQKYGQSYQEREEYKLDLSKPKFVLDDFDFHVNVDKEDALQAWDDIRARAARMSIEDQNAMMHDGMPEKYRGKLMEYIHDMEKNEIKQRKKIGFAKYTVLLMNKLVREKMESQILFANYNKQFIDFGSMEEFVINQSQIYVFRT